MLLTRTGWRLQEAIDYRAGLGRLGEIDPDLDWYAEYEGPRSDNPGGSYTIPAVMIAGHTASLEKRRDQFQTRGLDLRRVEAGGRSALFAAKGEESVIVVEFAADYSVTVSTTDASVDVRDLAAQLVEVDEDRWVAAGGQMIHCVPFEPGCAAADD